VRAELAMGPCGVEEVGRDILVKEMGRVAYEDVVAKDQIFEARGLEPKRFDAVLRG